MDNYLSKDDFISMLPDSIDNLLWQLDNITSANYMHHVAGIKCTLQALQKRAKRIIDEIKED